MRRMRRVFTKVPARVTTEVVGARLTDMSGAEFGAALRNHKALVGIPAVVYRDTLLTALQIALRSIARIAPCTAAPSRRRRVTPIWSRLSSRESA